jgi:hypothetical protein
MRIALLVVVAVAILLGPRVARADEVAPDLEATDLRVKAQGELRRLVSKLPANDQRRLTGVYAAFDANAADPFAQVACDDDGDYVVLLSDAMLRVASHVARAASYDDANGDRKVEDYASFLARSQVPGQRLLPPPPGFYIASRPADTYEERLAEVVSFVVARELTHLRAGDLVCPKPTATKESGDDVWTRAEQRKAAETASSVYPGRQVERDNEATVRVLEAGRTEEGALALLRFFARVETEGQVALSRFRPTYAVHHPSAAMRAAVVKQAAASHRTRGDE